MVFEWKASDEEFRRDFDAAYDSGTDVLESIARKRAIDGSDALMIFMLKTRDPARFNRKMLTISGDPDLPPVTVAAAQSQPVSPVCILPDNGRGPILEHQKPPPGFVPTPRQIESTAEPARRYDGLAIPAQSKL
jgi:hypothetical protein